MISNESFPSLEVAALRMFVMVVLIGTSCWLVISCYVEQIRYSQLWQIESSNDQVTRSTVHTVISPGSSLFRLCQLSAMGHCWWLRLFSEFLSEMSFLFKTISKGIAEIFVVSAPCWGGRYRRLLFTGQDFCKFCSVLDKIPHWPASSIDYYAKS